MIMLVELIVWWYGRGWYDALWRINRHIRAIWRMFSVGILLKTLFDPWKRITPAPGAGLDAAMRAMVDNLISRFVGFLTRLLVLIASLVITTLAITVGAAMAVGWLLLPIATVYSVTRLFIP